MATQKENVNITNMLVHAGIKPTPVRLLVLKTLMSSARPMSSQEIESELETVDRSSITRALALFTEEHLLHVIADGSDSTKYEICHDADHSEHKDEHAHFHCRHCGETICLTSSSINIPPLPDGYCPESVSFVITGLCPKCNK